MFEVTQSTLAEIRNHADMGKPSEVCGVVLVHSDGVQEVRRMRNAETARPARLYRFAPDEQAKIWRYARDIGAEIGAVYHSHPSHGPEPSAIDHSLASAQIPCYLILGMKTDAFAAYRPARYGLEWMPLSVAPLHR